MLCVRPLSLALLCSAALVAACGGSTPHTADGGTDTVAMADQTAVDTIASDTHDVASDAPTDTHANDAVTDTAPADAPHDTGACANPDSDHDGHVSIACGGDDCDDSDPNTFPGNTEVCLFNAATHTRVNPGHDEDCDPTTFANGMTHDGDQDGDGYIDVACQNTDHNGAVHRGDDCLDYGTATGFAGTTYSTTVQAGDIHPMEPEVCNGVDDNCNRQVDEGVGMTFYPDCDGDTYGSMSAMGTMACAVNQVTQCMGHAAVTSHTDCNDTNPAIHPNAQDTCDAAMVDEDCDGSANEGCTCTLGMTMTCGFTYPGCVTGTQTCQMLAGGGSVWSPCPVTNNVLSCYPDADNDGFAPMVAPTMACVCPVGMITNAPTHSVSPGNTTTDCNDGNGSIKPTATEVCDCVDNNCDGAIDEGLLVSWYQDGDNDGYGAGGVAWTGCPNATTSGTSCLHAPSGLAPNNTDCCDTDADAHPHGTFSTLPTRCGGYDYNCDGVESPEYTSAGSCFDQGDGCGLSCTPWSTCAGPNGCTGIAADIPCGGEGTQGGCGWDCTCTTGTCCDNTGTCGCCNPCTCYCGDTTVVQGCE